MPEMTLSEGASVRSVETPHEFPFNPENRTITWERLEALRLQKLGLSNRYSRHFNVLRQNRNSLEFNRGNTIACIVTPRDNEKKINNVLVFNKSNSIAPFATVGKPTCGYFFTDKTLNKKHNFGIPPSDLVKWRNFPSN